MAFEKHPERLILENREQGRPEMRGGHKNYRQKSRLCSHWIVRKPHVPLKHQVRWLKELCWLLLFLSQKIWLDRVIFLGKNLEGPRPRRLEKKVRRRQHCGLGKRNKTNHQKASWDGKRKLIMIFLKVKRKVRSWNHPKSVREKFHQEKKILPTAWRISWWKWEDIYWTKSIWPKPFLHKLLGLCPECGGFWIPSSTLETKAKTNKPNHHWFIKNHGYLHSHYIFVKKTFIYN